MIVNDLIDALGLTLKAGSAGGTREVKGGYVSDLLSDVMGGAAAGDVWVTLQTHQNIVAVASLKDIAAVVIVQSREPDSQTMEKADAEGIPILVWPGTTFEAVGRIYNLGVRGEHA